LNIRGFSLARAGLSGHFLAHENNSDFEVFAAIFFDWLSYLLVGSREVNKKSGNLLCVDQA